MGENVQRNMELMTPDIIELKTSKLFKENEISNLIKKRRHFDYKINGITKRLQDFTAAIQYERTLLLELMKRRKAKHRPLKKQNLDYLIIKRIQNFYSTAMVHFSNDYELHLEYYNFLKQYQSFQTFVTDHVKKMIQKFESNSQVFRIAASWFYKLTNQKEAIKILLRGLSRHPLDLELYIDLIELELKEADDQRLQERLKKYIDDIFKNIPGHIFLIEVLKILEFYPNLIEIQNYIITNLLEKYWCEEDVWHNVALRELKGIYYNAPIEDEEHKTTSKSIQRCVDRYKEGIAKLPLKKQPLLWKLYLSTMIDFHKENPDTDNALKADALRRALEDAKEARVKLDETHWVAWIDACGSNEELLVQRLDEGTREQPQSTMLWAIYLKHYILKDKAAQAEYVFERAVKVLGHRAGFIWEMYIDYHLLRTPTSDANELYERAVSEPYEEISKLFKPKYLTWTVASNSLEEGRKVYWEMADKPPYCKELHEEMMNLEQMENCSNDMDNQLKVMALYAKQFGDQDVDVWIQWISLDREQGGFDQNERERKIFEKAIKALPESMANDFREKYNALNPALT